MNKCLEFIAYGLHQIQRTFFPNLEHEAGPIPESLVELSYILQTIINPRRDTELKEALELEGKARRTLNWQPSEAVRYNERTAAERTNARLKDEFGGRTVRVRGGSKVFCHLIIGILVLTADQLMRLTT